MLPKVQFAISELPAGFFHLFGKEKPSLLVKAVLAAVFFRATRQGYLAIGSHDRFAVILCHLATAQ